MSEQVTIEFSVAGGEWWHYAALARLEWSQDKADQTYSEFSAYMLAPDSYRLVHPTGTMDIKGAEHKTMFSITTTRADAARWKALATTIRLAAAEAYEIRRLAIGTTFELILDEYYKIKDSGGTPNLREMAQAAGVKEGSLRQAKIRYDQQRRNS